MKQYNIYPTLLDAIQRYVDCDKTWEKYWGNSDEPTKTLAQYQDECLQELIDKFNRKPQEPNYDAECGTAFNELVDILQTGQQSTLIDWRRDEWNGYIVKCNGFEFHFCNGIVDEAAEIYKGASNQVYLEYTEQVKQGAVHLYGYADKVIGDKIIDIKTTKSYEWGKYEQNWQRYVYTLALKAMCGVEAHTFQYDVYEWVKNAEPKSAVFASEQYDVDIDRYRITLRGFLENVALPLIDSLADQLTDEAKVRLFN